MAPQSPPPPSSQSSPSKNHHHHHHDLPKEMTPTRLICYLFPPPYYLVLGLILIILPFSYFTHDTDVVTAKSSSGAVSLQSATGKNVSNSSSNNKTIVDVDDDDDDDNVEEFEKDLQSFIKEEEKLKKERDENRQRRRRRRLQQQEPPPEQPRPPQQQQQQQQTPPPPPPPPNQPSHRQYTYLTPLQIHTKLQTLASLYPEFLALSTTQSLYSLPSSGTTSDCPYDSSSSGCSNYVVVIEDSISNPPPGTKEDILNALGVTKYQTLPQIFLTAALSGTDQLGPVVLLETIELLLESAWCESLPRRSRHKKMDALPFSKEEIKEDEMEAKECRTTLYNKGIREHTRQWLARLVTTRRTVIMPIANSLGYYRNTVNEGGGEQNKEKFDPTFDFPFGKKGGKECMNTIAARSINEIFRSHMFQLGVSFHSTLNTNSNQNKQEGVYYPQTSQNMAPDAFSMKEIATTLNGYGGEFRNGMNIKEEEEETLEGLYLGTVGPISELDGNEKGRMEDWAYQGSWSDQIGKCSPTSHGGYNESYTTYDDATLRSVHNLVETQISSYDDETELGTTQDLFTPYGLGNGHVSRNIRLALSTIDLVEPYVTILGVDGYDIKDDIIPLMPRNEQSCRRTKIMKIPENGGKNDGKVIISWTVGGAFTVDSTAIMYGKWKDLDKGGGYFDCMTQPTKDELDLYFGNLRQQNSMESTVRFTEPQSGITRWHKNIPYPPPESEFLTPREAVFEVELDIEEFQMGDVIAVYAVARVDQGWKGSSGNNNGVHHPQSHIVNARTNPDWFHQREGKVIQGRIDWFSIPLTVEIGHSTSTTMEKSVRSPDDEWQEDEEEMMERYNAMSTWMMMKIIFYTAIFATMVFVCLFCREESDGTDVCAIWRERRRIEKSTTVQIEELYEDEDDESVWGFMNWFRFRRKRRMEGQGGGRFELSSQTIT